MIEVEDLRKQFGETVAVGGVSFTAGPGEIFGLLGPNGAGKSTTISCISGLLRPSGGRVRILGHDVVTEGPASRQRLGVVPQELALYEELSAAENLRYWGSAYGLRGAALNQRVKAVLETTGLLDRAGDSVKTFSGGMKRRLNFGCGLDHEPAVLLLDEPTVGVDPQSRERLLDLVRAEASRGVCVLYTTHYMEEAQALCERLAIIDHGLLIAKGTLAELRGQVGERDVLNFNGRFDPDEVRRALDGEPDIEVLKADAESLALTVADGPQRLSGVIALLDRIGAEIAETTVARASLESLFIKLTGKALRK